MSWDRLLRYIPVGKSVIRIGSPVDPTLDVGKALYNGEAVQVECYDGNSILNPGKVLGTDFVQRVLSPLSADEVGTIRCIGLNYKAHAAETGLTVPSVPVLFLRPSTSLNDPFPSPVVIPKFTIPHSSADYEAELVIIIGKECKDVSEEEALSYVLGYTAANDISSRVSQFEQSQWCFSKSFDTACPLGPVVVSSRLIPDPSKLQIQGILNGKTVQSSGINDLIFSVPKIISFLSQGTTMKPGTIILTGTPSGIGWTRLPTGSGVLRHGDVFEVHLNHGIGSLINPIEFEGEAVVKAKI